MLLLHNPVQAYAWGTPDGLHPLVGSEPSGAPEAELWVGTHPRCPSVVADDADGRTLAEVIAADPARWLGATLADAGHTALPFLLKVLAVGAPLSLQAHPSADQARAGFDREEAAGIAADAPHRTYGDPNPKPEALVALAETWALCGFRPPAEAAALLASLDRPELDPLVAVLQGAEADALRHALGWILRLTGPERAEVAAAAADGAAAAGARGDLDDPLGWVTRLAGHHPGDPGCLAPLLLQLVRLAPDDAVHLPAGNLHAYLAGAGVEVMAASDNVLRGGLTPKHVDVDELLAVLRFEPGVPPGPAVRPLTPGVTAYDAGEDAFALVRVRPADATGGVATIEPAGPSLLLATGGDVDLAGPDGGLTLAGGDGAFVAPGRGPIEVSGSGTLWWATTGNALPG